MTDPILRVASSGYEGSGYAVPTEVDSDGQFRRVPGVTTITKISYKPAIVQWAVDNTAAYAVSNVDALLNRSEVEGYGFLRWRWKNEPKLDSDPNLRNWHGYVLNDAADMGTWFHEYAEADLLGDFLPEITEGWQQQMVDAWEQFKFERDVEVGLVECTVYNPVGYAGTFDLMARIDGVGYLLDIKGLPLDTEIPTPSGFSTMGELQIGDEVFGRDGSICRVTAKSEVHHNPCMKIVLQNGEEIIADEDHRWVVRKLENSRDAGECVMTTREIHNFMLNQRPGFSLSIPIAGATQTPDVALPIDPYVLGVWLGDGTATKNEITINDTTKVSIPDHIRGRGVYVEERRYQSDEEGHALRIVLGDPDNLFGGTSAYKRKLRELGVLGSKHIPETYMQSGTRQRLDLLRGIMDTDGGWNIARNNEVNYATTDPAFSQQVEQLASSLGFRVSRHQSKTSWTHKGVRKETTSYVIRFRPADTSPFLAREYPGTLDSSRQALNRKWRIKSVDTVDTVPTQCIEVDSEDHTYLFGRKYYVTHNTSRGTWPEHYMQLAALGAAPVWLRQTTEDEAGAVKYVRKDKPDTWWIEDVLPSFDRYAILHVRPDTDDGPAFCVLKEVDNEVIDLHYEWFLGDLTAQEARRKVKEYEKLKGKER